NYQRGGLKMASEQARRSVLVDNSSDAADPAIRIDRNRDAASAAADDDLARIYQLLDGRHFDDFSRQRRRHHAAEAAFALVADLPAILRAMRFGLRWRQHRANRFVWLLKCTVIGVDSHGWYY